MTVLLMYLAIAIGVSFLCSILEAVLLSIRPSFLETMLIERPGSGEKISRVKERIDESLSSILILNTFAHTMGAAGVGAQALLVFGAKWETLIAVLLTLVILFFSEIIPKTLGATYWRRLAVPSAHIILWLVRIVYPLVWVSSRLTKLFSSNKEDEITREEILALASLGHKGGALISRENEYLSNLLGMRDIRTEQILTPRTVVHMLDESTSIKDALNHPKTRQFTRVPIYAGNNDSITGKVIRVDMYEAERAGRGDEPLKSIALELDRVSERLPVQNLLDRLIKKSIHMVLVEDEFGQNAGIVTLEDAIETLLGREILDESDTVADMQEMARDKYRERLRDVRNQEGSE